MGGSAMRYLREVFEATFPAGRIAKIVTTRVDGTKRSPVLSGVLHPASSRRQRYVVWLTRQGSHIYLRSVEHSSVITFPVPSSYSAMCAQVGIQAVQQARIAAKQWYSYLEDLALAPVFRPSSAHRKPIHRS